MFVEDVLNYVCQKNICVYSLFLQKKGNIAFLSFQHLKILGSNYSVYLNRII